MYGAKWAKCMPVFRPKRSKNPDGAAHTYMAYIREYPPPSLPWAVDSRVTQYKENKEVNTIEPRETKGAKQRKSSQVLTPR